MRTARALTLLLTAGLVVLLLTNVAARESKQPAPHVPGSQFRITFGNTDSSPKDWSGRVHVERAKLESIKGWRFSEQDSVGPDGSFHFQTRRGMLENQLDPAQPYGQTDWNDPRVERLIPEGFSIRLRGSASRVAISTSNGSFDFRPDQVQFGRPRIALSGNAIIERLPVEAKLSEAGSADDFPALAVAPDGQRWVAWLAYESGADRVVVSGGGKLHVVTGRGDHQAPAIAVDGTGQVWVAWSENINGSFQLFATRYSREEWAPAERLTSEGGSNLWPQLTSDGRRSVAVVWQGFRNNESVALGRLWDGKRWSAEQRFGEGSSWMPQAAFGGGKLWVAWDSYATGSYQIYAQEWKGTVERVTTGDNFAAHASIAVDSAGRPLIAFEESDPLWGKDFSFLYERRGTTLYKNRRIRIVYRDGGGWKEMPGSINEAVPSWTRRYIQQPRLAIDGGGRLFLAFRSRTSTAVSRIDNLAVNGTWETFLTYRSRGRWQPAILMPSSVGRNSMREAIAIHAGSVHVAWASDDRSWANVQYGDLDIYAAEFATSMASGGKLRGGVEMHSAALAKPTHLNESADVKRVRAYRYNLNGRQYRILRGDLHRHTELSNDGAGDGTIDDLYRYALDAAAMDFAYVSDHQMGMDEEYNWWLTQKSNDMYSMPQRFVPLYGYERSVPYPNGHRNIIWAERGEKVLKVTPAESRGAQDTGPTLFPYLRDSNGISMPHASATAEGTDWRNNDAVLEPLVEIYQGYESNYEHAGAPRTWKEGDKPLHGGQRPLGFVWDAWAKGYKLGVQASSDHISTHTSYTCILAEDFTRQALVNAMKKRHTYGATDNIVVDFRISTPEGTYLMGDIFESKSLPRLIVRILGTAPVAKVHIVKNNRYIHSVEPNTKDVSFEFMDSAAEAGTNYYYIRVEQSDGELAWSSPIWITN